MGGPAVVTIRRQVLDVDLHGTEADGLALQRRLPGVCADVLAPAIEAVLGAFDPGDRYVHLDRLAVDLTLPSLDGLESELAAAVQREIRDRFRRLPLPQVASPETPGPPSPPGEPVSPFLPGRPGAPGEAGDVRHRTFTETVDDALVTFLRTGRLPWSFRLAPGRTLEETVHGAWREAGGQDGPPPGIRPRLLALLAVPDARDRLAIQFSPGFVTAVLRCLSPDAAVLLAQVEAALGGAVAASPAGRAFIRSVRVDAIEAAVAGRRPRPDSLVRSAWTTLGPAGPADRTLAAGLERAWPGSTGPVSTGPGNTSAGNAPVPERTAGSARARPAAPDAGETGGLLVDCAGIVLLHPFLPRFFEGLGVAAGDRLIDPGRALCLLHHLATGELTAPEHRVTLAKALCGLPLDQPVEADVGLTGADTAEATALLEAVVGHWVALRSTSPGALRAEFLQRSGVLSATSDGDRLLRVETRTADILLDQLPWGLSPVWLPWMSRLMTVEWR